MSAPAYNIRKIFFAAVLTAVYSIAITDVRAACTAPSRYCSREGQKTNTSQSAPLPSNRVPEASSGFQGPLQGVRFATNSSGNGFAQKDSVSYPNCGTIYHPGLDLNWGSRNDDCGSNIGSIADGVVVWIGRNSDWQGLMVQHKYQGEMVLAAYGHVVEIDPRLSVGDTVRKGQYLARVGSVGANSCHLHFEIRKIGSHPDPMNGAFFCPNRRENDVRAWYYSPEPFIDSHYAYSLRPDISLSAPSRVSRSGLRTYEFIVGVQERGGAPVTIDYVYIGNDAYTGKSFFGASRLSPYASMTRRFKLDRWLLWEQTIPYTVKVLNPNTGRLETWTKNIILRPW